MFGLFIVHAKQERSMAIQTQLATDEPIFFVRCFFHPTVCLTARCCIRFFSTMVLGLHLRLFSCIAQPS